MTLSAVTTKRRRREDAANDLPRTFQRLSAKATAGLPQQLLSSLDAVVFDCDGVIWRGVDPVSPNVPRAIKKLRALGKRVFFVTNNSSKTRDKFVEKLAQYGVTAAPDEMYTSSYTASEYIKLRCPEIASGEKQLFMLGTEGMEEELKASVPGIRLKGGPTDPDFQAGFRKLDMYDPSTMASYDIPDDFAGVIVGFDPAISYYKIQYAHVILRRPDTKFLATNPDQCSHLTKDQLWAACGAMVGAIKGCTGREPTVIGKPNPLVGSLISERFKIEPGRMMMVGDRLDTDVKFGIDAGMKTCLVMSGVAVESDLLEGLGEGFCPDFVCPEVGEFFEEYEDEGLATNVDSSAKRRRK